MSRYKVYLQSCITGEQIFMNEHFISTRQLHQQLNENIVILDCRFSLADPAQGSRQYHEGHIPGAVYFSLDDDLSGSVKKRGGRHPLPDTEAFTQKLQNAGVNQDTLIVCYDDSRMAFAARAWWLLNYFGHARTLILNGGYNAWITDGYSLSKNIPVARHGQFKPQIKTDAIVDAGYIHDCLSRQSTLLIDSREEKRFQGLEEPIDPVAGHIPGAWNFPWQSVTDENGCIKSADEQRIRWQTIPDSNEIVVYCGSGVTACVNLLSLTIAGRKAKLYPGSWSDWCSYEQYPKAVSGPQS